MESIDRLRDWLQGRLLLGDGWNELNKIADAIEREGMEERTAAYNEGYDAGFASADDWAAQHEDAMAEHGWVRLPVDADGVPIHVGDMMYEGKVAKVVLTDKDWEPSVYVYKLPNVQHEFFCNEVSHYRAPTVEDVLREFAQEMAENAAMYVAESWDADERDEADAAAIAEYAAKLRLAGDE